MRKVFTIIKGESERVPRKNFLEIGGRPLWRWLVDELSGNDVYINTDSESLYLELLDIPHVTPIRRDKTHVDWEVNAKELGSPVMDMVREFCETYLDESEDFALVHVTSPFLRSTTLEAAFEKFESTDCHSIHSVRMIKDFLMTQGDDGLIPFNFSYDRVSRTQDLEPMYQSLGAFFIMNSEKLRQHGYKRLMSNSIIYPVTAIEAVEVDNVDELMLVGVIATTLKGERL